MDPFDQKKWTEKLSNYAPQLIWTAHAKKHSYTDRTFVTPKNVEDLLSKAFDKTGTRKETVAGIFVEQREKNQYTVDYFHGTNPGIRIVVEQNGTSPLKIITYAKRTFRENEKLKF